GHPRWISTRMAPSGSDAFFFDVHHDGVFLLNPFRYEHSLVYDWKLYKNKKMNYKTMLGLKIIERDYDVVAMYEFDDAYGKLDIDVSLCVDYCSDYQYAVSIKEDTAYLCLHSPKTTKETRSNTPYPGKAIRRIQCYMGIKYSGKYQTWSLLQETPNTPLEEEKAQKRWKVFNWETVKYGKIWYDEDVLDLRSIETEFPAIVFNDKLTSNETPSCEPTNEFTAIVYNEALTSKLDFSTEPTLCPQHINEFDLKDETSLSEYDEVEQSILYFNDLFPFNIVYPDNQKSDKGNDEDEIDMIQSLGGNENTNKLLKESHNKIRKVFIMGSFIMGLNVNIVAWNLFVNGMLFNLIKNLYVSFGITFNPKRYYKDGDCARILRRPRREIHRVQVFDFGGLPDLMAEGLSTRMLMDHRDAQGQRSLEDKILTPKFKEDLITYCVENGIFQDSQDTFESSDDNTNVVNAPREPIVVNQDPGVKSSQDPPQIDQNCCYECGDSLDGIFCRQCICKSCGKGAHFGYNCPPKDPIISKPEPCNQTINEIPQTLPSLDPSCYSLSHVSKPNLDNDPPNVFNQPPQPQFETYLCELCGNNAHYGYDCSPQFPFVYEQEPYYNQNFNDNYFPQNSQSYSQQYLCCANCGGPHETFQCQPMNEDYYEQNSCYYPNSSSFDQPQPPQDSVYCQEALDKILEELEELKRD
ncbi:hypothetical protein Tco_0377853, partial [Tanacetum coccineum]